MAFKLKIRSKFPALVTATSPLTLVKTGLAYAFGLDISALRSTLDPVYLNPTLTNIILSGSTSGTVTVKAPAVAGSNIATIPAATDTLVGKATTDTLTNKTFDSAGTGNVMKVSGVTVSAGQYPGEVGTGSATAGNVGEYVESVIAVGAQVALVNGTAKTITSISLTAGDWDIDGVANFNPAASTSITNFLVSISGTTNALDTTPGKLCSICMAAVVPGIGVLSTQSFPPYRLSLSGTTSVFLVAQSSFTVSTLSTYGIVRARRVR